jgi:hypothetical protein
MNDAYAHNFIPTTDGRLNAGPPHVNQRWARIDFAATINGTTMYGWTEMTPYLRTLVPMVGGMAAKTQNFVIEPNGLALTVGSFVKVRPGYFDPVYDTVYFCESNPLAPSAATFSGAHVTQSIGGNINSGVRSNIWGTATADYDTSSYVSTDHFAVPSNGYYSGWAQILAASAAAGFLDVYVDKGSVSGFNQGTTSAPLNNANNVILEVSFENNFAAGDKLYFGALQTSGGALAVQLQYAVIHKIG